MKVRLDSHLTTLYEIPGYVMHTNCRNFYGGGVTLHVNTDYDSMMISGLVIAETFTETVSVEVTISTKKHKYLCINRLAHTNFTRCLEKKIISSVYDRKYEDIIILGDFDMSLLQSNNADTSDFVKIMFSF